MQVDALSLQLRPRPMAEAADLGVRLVQAHAASLWRCFAPVWAAVAALALATHAFGDWAPWLLLLLAKPWLDRTLLFVLARAVFGEATRWADLWAAQRAVWWRDLPHTLLWQRLSPWRAMTQAVGQLEGQRGAARRRRSALLMRGRRGIASLSQAVWLHLEMVLMAGLVALVMLMVPDEYEAALWRALFAGEHGRLDHVFFVAYAGIVLVLEPFFVAAGFAMYLNRRVELEAWDVEQELRRVFAA
jgi:hypothetical protein